MSSGDGDGELTAAWTSARVFPAGSVAAGRLTEAGTGITSEQSIRDFGFCPTVARRFMTFSNLVTMLLWSAVIKCVSALVVLDIWRFVRTDERLPLAGRAGCEM